MAVGVPDNGTTTETGLVLVGLKVNSISQLCPGTSVVRQFVSMVNGAPAGTGPREIVSVELLEFDSSVP
jgi:hypothetical protein